jgi:hypothetical protein
MTMGEACLGYGNGRQIFIGNKRCHGKRCATMGGVATCGLPCGKLVHLLHCTINWHPLAHALKHASRCRAAIDTVFPPPLDIPGQHILCVEALASRQAFR